MNRSVLAISRLFSAVALAVSLGAAAVAAQSQITVTARITPVAKPAWDKGIGPITPESYYNAIECGKNAGNPACVFWDTGLCKNPDFDLAMYTPYKSVAYEVWRATSQKKPAPQPNYAEAQRTRITIGVTPVRGSKNTFSQLVLKRAGKVVEPTARELTTRRFTFDFFGFAPSAGISIDLVGDQRTITCNIDASTLKLMR